MKTARPAIMLAILSQLAFPAAGLRARLALSPPVAQAPAGAPTSLFEALAFRNIGPATTSGRISDIAVLETDPSVFYVATATGGLWKTTNNGTTWEVQFAAQDDVVALGDVTIPPDDANLVWVGTGEDNNRQSASWGRGVYKSIDGGGTWAHMGLANSGHVGRIAIDPANHDVVYVAATGPLWSANRERGIFKTTDGGATWTHSLFVDEDTGATDLIMDPSNSRVLYAAAYQRRRAAWGFNGGGPGSGIYKSSDAGRTWTKLAAGIPGGPLGRIGLDIYRRNPQILYARIQHATESGIYRTDDGGASWRKMSDLNPRPMYFGQIRIDPNDDLRIYVPGVQLDVSNDGGRTFISEKTTTRTLFPTSPTSEMHVDHHAMWIDPANSRHALIGSDGGIGVTYDAARTWDFIDNMDIAQFYHVGYDMDTPYNLYGGLQDNNVWTGPSAVRSRLHIGNGDWSILGVTGGDGFAAFPEPDDPRTIFTEWAGGRLYRVDRRSNERKLIQPVAGPGQDRLRWNWDAPFIHSNHAPRTLFVASQKVFKSVDAGQSWTAISPDLTSGADREGFSLMGIPAPQILLSKNDGVSEYPTISAFAESPKTAGLYYAGTDDGLVQVSRDGGRTWTNVSANLPNLPERSYVSRLEPSRFDEGTVYATFDNHRSGNNEPYAFVSRNYGRSWASIASTLPKGHAVRCLKEDQRNPNVVYLGTEFGLFVSLNRGEAWTRARSNLPTVPIYEIVQHPRDNDLILATHGRGIWILDDATPIQDAADAVKGTAYLFDVRPATLYNVAFDRPALGDRRFWGQNPAFGAAIDYYLSAAAQDVRLEIESAEEGVIRKLSDGDVDVRRSSVIRRVYWDLRYEPVGGGDQRSPNTGRQGPLVLPGEYRVNLRVDGRDAASTHLRVQADPGQAISDADRREWHDTSLRLHRMQKTATDAAAALARLADHFSAVSALAPKDRSAAALDNLRARSQDIAAQLGVALRRGSGRGGRGGGAFQGLGGRIGSLESEILESTSRPTDAQMRTAGALRQALLEAVEALNQVLTVSVAELHATLAAEGITAPAVRIDKVEVKF